MSAFTFMLAAIELVSPAMDSTVTIVPENQKAVMSKVTLAERQEVFAEDAKNGKKIRHGKWREAVPFYVKWRATAGEKGPWEVLIGKKPDLSDAVQYLYRESKIDKATGREVEAGEGRGTYRQHVHYANLEIATRYYWKVSGNITCGRFGHGRKCDCPDRRPMCESAVGTFVTEDFAPRWIEIEGRTSNFRDLGGRIGLGGRRVKQGMVFRSQGLNDNSVDGVCKGRNRLSCADLELLVGTYGIRTDLDLRGPGETAGMNGISPLGKEVRFVNRSSSAYVGIFTESGKKVMAENFREFCDAKNYPILFHCIGGADRTGALGYVLNGVLGVKRQELETDWESTFYPAIPFKAKADTTRPDERASGLAWNSEQHFNNGFSKYGGESSSWNERIILYLKDCGITDAEIATFRGIMLEK